jgi:hypothetical protein
LDIAGILIFAHVNKMARLPSAAADEHAVVGFVLEIKQP